MLESDTTPDPRSGSALARASTVQHDASLKGFDWDDPIEALEKVREEADEVGSLLATASVPPGGASGPPPAHPHPEEPHDRLDEELGDLLFAVVNVARIVDVDPAPALARATAKFEERFAEVERLARLRGLPMPGTPLAELDRIWDEVKAAAAAGQSEAPGASAGPGRSGAPNRPQ